MGRPPRLREVCSMWRDIILKPFFVTSQGCISANMLFRTTLAIQKWSSNYYCDADKLLLGRKETKEKRSDHLFFTLFMMRSKYRKLIEQFESVEPTSWPDTWRATANHIHLPVDCDFWSWLVDRLNNFLRWRTNQNPESCIGPLDIWKVTTRSVINILECQWQHHKDGQILVTLYVGKFVPFYTDRILFIKVSSSPDAAVLLDLDGAQNLVMCLTSLSIFPSFSTPPPVL